MVTRRVKTGGAYVGAGGLGAPSPPQWQNTYEDQEFTGAYVADPGGGPDQWQYSGGVGGPSVPAVTNLSGNLNNATNWYSTSGSLTVSRLSHAQFLAEQPGATIPLGHIDANGIIKTSLAAPNGFGYSLRGINLALGNFTSFKNITLRGYMPPDQYARYVAAANPAMYVRMSSDAVGTYTNIYQSQNLRYAPASVFVTLDKGNWHYPCIPNAWSASDNLSNTLSNLHPTAGVGKVGVPTTFEWINIEFRGDSTASPAQVMYIFDIVELAEDLPTLYLSFDDGYAEHRAVSQCLRGGTTFASGALAAPLPVNFSIINSAVDTASFVTSQNLRDMAAEGASLIVHGSGGTWSTVTTAAMVAEITSFQSRVATEGWNPNFGKTVTYPGNDYSRATTDAAAGVTIQDIAAANGIKVGRGNASQGRAYSLAAVDDKMRGIGLVTLGTPGTGSLDYINSAALVETLMAFMAFSKMSVIMMGHQVQASPPTAPSIAVSQAAFDDVMLAIAAEVASATPRIRVGDLVSDAASLGYYA